MRRVVGEINRGGLEQSGREGCLSFLLTGTEPRCAC